MSREERFAEYLDSCVVPDLHLTFDQVMNSYMNGTINQDYLDFFKKAYIGLNTTEKNRLHAAFKIITTSGNHEAYMKEMIQTCDWSGDDHHSTLMKVLNFVAQKFTMSFPHPTNYYDIHVYFDDVSFSEAEKVKEKLTELGLKSFAMQSRPIGPHPKRMFECHVTTPDEYYAAVILIKRSGLTALVHPNDPYVFREQHYTYARWINGQLTLRTEW
jgi:aromatic ring-cleaving dioxygenase